MAIVRTGESAHDKELAKWDLPKSQGGYNADGYEAFPAMLYKAHQRENGKVMCLDMDALYAGDMNTVTRAEAFNKSCQLKVMNQHELDRALANGWRKTPQEALEHHESLQQDIAQAAAEAAFAVKRMSDKAQREYDAADAASEHPTTDVPVPAKGPRGRRVAVAG